MIRMIDIDDTDWGITTAPKSPCRITHNSPCFLLFFCCCQYFPQEVIAVLEISRIFADQYMRNTHY